MSETKMTDPSSGPRFCPECGSRLEPDGSCSKCLLVIGLTTGTGTAAAESLSLAPEQIPGYRLEERVGQGGMGVVWRAHHLNLQRTVAIKVLAHSVRGIPGFAERFHREARTMAGLSHRNVVTIHDFGETDGLYWLVMEYVDGLNLRELMNEVVAPRRALKIVTQICEALDYAHEAGIVHRDIKPENVLVDAKGQVKLGDFGLAKLLDGSEDRTRLTGSRHVMGTPHYMAPEQVNAPLDVDHRADIFSLGVVFYELLTGELPMGNFAPPSQENDTDPRLDEVVLRALHHKPADRYQRASEVKDDITAVEQAPGGGSTGSADLQIRSDGDAGSARKAGADLEVRAPVGDAGSARKAGADLEVRAPVGERLIPVWLQFWELPVALAGVFTCAFDWRGRDLVGAPDWIGVHALDNPGGLFSIVGFTAPVVIWIGMRFRTRNVPVAVALLLGGIVGMFGVLYFNGSVRQGRSSAYMITAAACAVLLITGGTFRLAHHVRVPYALLQRVQLVALLVAIAGLASAAVPWHRAYTGGPAVWGFEHSLSGVAWGMLAVLLVWLLVTRGLKKFRWDGAATAATGIGCTIIASAYGAKLRGQMAGLYLLLTVGVILLVIGIVLMMPAREEGA